VPTTPTDDDRSAADQRLAELLTMLQADRPRSDEGLTLTVVRAAGWQRALRSAVDAVNAVLAPANDLLALILGTSRRSGKE
jgi:hypothetical protein